MGGGTGAGITYIIMKKQLEKELKLAREEYKSYYERKDIEEIDAMATHEKAVPDKPEKAAKDDSEKTEKRQYSDLVKRYVPEPLEDDEDPAEEATVVADNIQEHLEKTHDRTKILKPEHFGELTEYECETLRYYVHDKTLVHEDESIVDDPAFLLGDALDRYGWADDDEEEEDLYVRNYKLQRDYEVVKVFDEYPAE